MAQIDRKVGERDDPKPRMSDLRGSGDLENAPDNVIFCYRPEYYLQRKNLEGMSDEDKNDHYVDLSKWKDKMEIIVAKARMGEIGAVTVGCDMGTNRFWDLDQQEGLGF